MVSFPNSLNPKAWEVDISVSMLNCSGVRAIICGGEVLHMLVHSRGFQNSVNRASRRKIQGGQRLLQKNSVENKL